MTKRVIGIHRPTQDGPQYLQYNITAITISNELIINSLPKRENFWFNYQPKLTWTIHAEACQGFQLKVSGIYIKTVTVSYSDCESIIETKEKKSKEVIITVECPNHGNYFVMVEFSERGKVYYTIQAESIGPGSLRAMDENLLNKEIVS